MSYLAAGIGLSLKVSEGGTHAAYHIGNCRFSHCTPRAVSISFTVQVFKGAAVHRGLGADSGVTALVKAEYAFHYESFTHPDRISGLLF